MPQISEVRIATQDIDQFRTCIGDERLGQVRQSLTDLQQCLGGRAWWNVNSTARGGGVAELLQSLLAYARGAGIDARWCVISATPDFFAVTKRIHHALHGSAGDRSPLGDKERRIYDEVMRQNANDLLGLVRRGDPVLLHDPQTLGLAPALRDAGAVVVWQCHVGADTENDEVRRGWHFLQPYLEDVEVALFTRAAYIPKVIDNVRTEIIPPSIDPFSAKNEDLAVEVVRAILVHTGLVEGPEGDGQPTFTRQDGTPSRVDRRADVTRYGRAPTWETPLVVQVSRWDPLKDPLGVLQGFAGMIERTDHIRPELVLAGPNVNAVSDDPEGAKVFAAVVDAWRNLPEAQRDRIHLASLPMADVEENAAIVNALQRHAAVVVQKSLHEGFGLTVTEAMWKARPLVASAVGGVQDQIDDGVEGLLLADPKDLAALGQAVYRLVADPELGDQLGKQARHRVEREYLNTRQLEQYANLLTQLVDEPDENQ